MTPQPPIRRAALVCAVVAAAACLALLAALTRPQDPPPPATAIGDLLGGAPATGFARALAPRALRFPEDHGAHADFRTEWWYVTGNLHTEAARHFGFELTFFRFALAPVARKRSSAWATNQVYMAHFAVTDTAGRRHIARERFERAALGLAGADASPFRVWLGNWTIASDGAALFPVRLTAQAAPIALELELAGSKPPVPHGDRGFSRKGPQAGNASHYYSYTRLPAAGRIRIGDEAFTVTGQAWIDHEWSTSALGDGVEGWDWFALQLDDGTDLMYYRLRRSDGASDSFSAGSLVAADGRRTVLEAADVVVEARAFWKSPATGITYPVAWRLRLPRHGLALDLSPRLAAQEMALSVRYWEGAVTAAGVGPGGPLRGEGYVELTGYGGRGAAGR